LLTAFVTFLGIFPPTIAGSHLPADYITPHSVRLKLNSLRSETMPDSGATTTQDDMASQAEPTITLQNLDPQSEIIRPPYSNTFKHFPDCRDQNHRARREWCPLCYIKSNVDQVEAAVTKIGQVMKGKSEHECTQNEQDEVQRYRKKALMYLDNIRQANRGLDEEEGDDEEGADREGDNEEGDNEGEDVVQQA